MLKRTKRLLRSGYDLLARALPHRQKIILHHYRVFGKVPDLQNPRSFNEHIAALMAAPIDQRMVLCADKVAVKSWAEERIGADFIIPTLWHGTDLPSQERLAEMRPFILKSSHASQTVVVVKKDQDFVRDDLQKIANSWLSLRLGSMSGERWYNEIEPGLLIEPYLADDLDDFKIFCFNGVPRMIQVDANRFINHQRSLFDVNFKQLPFAIDHSTIDRDVPAPRHLDKMLAAARKLSKGFKFARVDFYDLPQGAKFGEVTFAPEAGLSRFEPRSADLELGSWFSEPVE